MSKFFKNILTKDTEDGTSLESEFSTLSNGIKRTETFDTRSPVSLIGIVDSTGKKNKPGFTPLDSYNFIIGSVQPGIPSEIPTSWYGNLLDSHINSVNYKFTNKKSTSDKFDESKSTVDGYSTRDRYILSNDASQDYFRHGFAINGRTPIKTAKNDREAWDGVDGADYRLKTFKNTPFENEDPVMYGFEIIIDAISSPLLNGSVEDFINAYNVISEIQSRRSVIYDFKKQFEKIFKTKGKIFFATEPLSSLQSAANNAYASAQTQKNDFRPGRKAYLSHYLQKITGLDSLSEANDVGAFKPHHDYSKDKLTLSFYEDVSGTMGVIAHLYKLLYWSKPNSKSIVPENLLRFNCEIVVSEVRNFNRVRKALQTVSSNSESIEIIKDNVSRYIYSLRECQFFFSKMPHDDSVALNDIKTYDNYDISMNFKFSTTKFEKWIPDREAFGQYVGYNNGAIWKIGNKGFREQRAAEKAAAGGNTANIVDNSIPRFYTQGTNTLNHNGVTTAIIFDKITLSPPDNTVDDVKIGPATGGNSYSGDPGDIGGTKNFDSIGINKNPLTMDELGEDEGVLGAKSTKANSSSGLDQFKENAKNVASNLAGSVQSFVVGEINNQILIRSKLLENTINKIKSSLGLSVIDGEKNVYPKPYTPHSFGPWFDVRNELFNFLTEDTANLLANADKATDPNAYPDINKINQFKQQTLGQKLDVIYDKNTKWTDINDIKFGNKNDQTNYYGSLKNIINNKSNPSVALGNGVYKPIGQKDFSKIGFGIGMSDHQKYPAPISIGMNILAMAYVTLFDKTNIKFGTFNPTNIKYGNLKNIIDKKSNPSVALGNGLYKSIGQEDFSKIGFGITKGGDAQKYPVPVTQNVQNVEIVVKSNTKWNYPTNDIKFGSKR